MYVGVAQICYTKIHIALVKNSFLDFYLISLFLDFLSSYGARDLAAKEIVPVLPRFCQTNPCNGEIQGNWLHKSELFLNSRLDENRRPGAMRKKIYGFLCFFLVIFVHFHYFYRLAKYIVAYLCHQLPFKTKIVWILAPIQILAHVYIL